MNEPFDARHVEDRVHDIVWPEPSAALRDRVQAIAVVAPQLTWSDRIWFSRRWRSAAVAIALAAIALNWMADLPATPISRPTPQRIAEAEAIVELAEQAGLPRSAAVSLARRVLAPDTRPPLTAGSAFELLQGSDGEIPGGTR